ncbi:Respiratory supercomplex factor 1, mitochondrial [Neolecta irregularis DAH-3]|uniref:Respiratory supercomplex factor 1, mitochondrial n=1 Tax=Neolecta irregularis (strain DAH-3) TaxID=1198029 RepID=A0A1U7LNX3_NEOID|nr:Respiratory supercomplex factor 1, mitochondrial [Neolecta irregularis DAH-3]|eukprot:OLL24355.1 Respiratory supercomplex factor 1, mitochondrial [Neolecta irregularis DAH-3]
MSSQFSSAPDPEKPLSGWSKIVYESKRQPLVPLGCLITCGALIGAAIAGRKGNKLMMNYMFRLRVAAQGATVVALIGGSLYYSKKGSSSQRQDDDSDQRRVRQQEWLKKLDEMDQKEKRREAALEKLETA